MMKCLLFGHKPDEWFEYTRNGNRRHTYCERCGVDVTHVVGAHEPLPPDYLTDEDRDALFARRVAAEVAPLLPKKRSRKPKPEVAVQ